MKQSSLRWRITVGLLAYAALLTVALVSAASVLSEKRERAVWRVLLTQVMEHDAHIAGLLEAQPDTRASVRLVDLDSAEASVLPEAIRALKPGLHERSSPSGQPFAVLVHVTQGHRIAALIDISGHERTERRLLIGIIVAAVAVLSTLLVTTWWLAGRLLRPVTDLSARVRILNPMYRGERVQTEHRQQEILEIETAVNAFLERLDAFVVREREFIDTVSHELRTPMATIAGASDVLADSLAPGAPGRSALDRIRTTVTGVEETITALLYLAKDPTAFAESEPFRLDQLLPSLVHEHSSLLNGRDVEIQLQPLQATMLLAPARVATIAIGNLLRNAIEHAPAGIIHVSLRDGVVEILDEGVGMDAARISRLYRAQVTGIRPPGSGIGLYVIGRICERLGWQLHFEARDVGGTCSKLDVTASVVRQ